MGLFRRSRPVEKLKYFFYACGLGLKILNENLEKYLGSQMGWFRRSGPVEKPKNVFFLMPVGWV